MKNNKQQSAQLDLFTPVYEIFHELCMLFCEVIVELTKRGYSKYRELNGLSAPLQKIDRKKLNVRKEFEIQESLGTDTKSLRPVYLKDIDFTKHSFIVGASGFGKTNLISILQEQSVRVKKPIIFFDPKGDTKALNTFKQICKTNDRPCYIFSEHSEESISLNPLLEGSANQVTDRIMGAFEWSEPYYQDYSRKCLFKILKKLEFESKAFTLINILDELKKIEDKDNLGLINKLDAIQSSDFGKILNADNKNGLTLSKIRKKNACLYIGLSTQGYGDTAIAIGKLFLGELLFNSYSNLISKEEENTGLKNPISVYFDEFGSLVTLQFIELLNKCRGAGIELTVAVQTASDIDRVCPSLTQQVLENCGNIFVMKQRLQQGAEIFSEAIGTVISKKQTYRIEANQKMSTGTEREVHELLVHPDIIKNLEVGQCILLRQAPTKLNLINIRNRKFDYAINIQRNSQQTQEPF